MRTAKEVIDALYAAVPKFVQEAHPIFKKMGWTWHGDGVPTPMQIESTLYSLLQELEKSTKGNMNMYHNVETGRLGVFLMRYNESWHGRLAVIADWIDVS